MTPVLLHGAGTGGWVWERVMAAMSRPALAPDLPTRERDLSPGECAEDVVRDLDRHGVGDVALVLHSLAGVLGGELAVRLGARLRHVIYLAAVIPPDHGSFAQARGFPTALVLRALFAFGKRRLKPTEPMIRKEYGNDLTEEDVRMLVDRIVPDRPRMLLAPVTAPVPVLPATYVRLTLDRSLKPSEQNRMIARLTGPRVVDVEAGHMAPLSRPEAIAAAIEAGMA